LPVAQSVPGFSQALKRMKKGGKYKLIIPPALGYGAKAAGPIPANNIANNQSRSISVQKLLTILVAAMLAAAAGAQARLRPPRGGVKGTR